MVILKPTSIMDTITGRAILMLTTGVGHPTAAHQHTQTVAPDAQ